MKGFFVTGTDTGVGKTVVSAGLGWALNRRGQHNLALKPVAAGQDFVDGRWVNEDVQRLREASGSALDDDDIACTQLRTACAPHIAAALEGTSIERERVLRFVRSAGERAPLCVVEGVGGFRVPLTDTWDAADLAVDLGLPVVLVVGMRLGCLNHALLTAESVRARGLRLAGWIANAPSPTPMPHQRENVAALQARLPAPLWGEIPHLPGAGPAAIAACLHADLILKEIHDHDRR